MTNGLDQAIAEVRNLPAERQDEAAEILALAREREMLITI